MSKRKTKAMAAQFARECEQDPKRPGSRLRKNTPVIGRAAQIAEHAAVVKRRQELAAAAAHRRAEARAEWAAELEQLRKVENRRIKRIERDGISVNDIALVCGLAQDMLGGIGPKGIATNMRCKCDEAELREIACRSHPKTDVASPYCAFQVDDTKSLIQGSIGTEPP